MPTSALLLMLLTGFASPAPPPPPTPESSPGQRFSLTDGALFVPESFRPDPAGVTLTLHLHGAAWAAERWFVRGRQPGVLVSVVLPGLSAVYTEKFRDPQAFRRILEETQAKLAPLCGGQPPRLHRVVATSFSAGFGGVRELLRDPEAFARIDGLVMADSIHAGFAGDPAARQVNPEAMEGFLKFAREAVAGRKRMVISHSQIRPSDYASTTETADYLLAVLGGARESVHETWPGDLLLLSRFRKGGLEIDGFAGETGPDHMKHLHHLDALLGRLNSLSSKPMSPSAP